MQQKIRFLHIAKDDKFFDSVINSYEQDGRLTNSSIVIKEPKGYELQIIKDKENVTVLTIREAKEYLQKGDYDVVFFHSIAEGTWRFVDWIPKGKIIIWWSWGYDIYNSRVPYYKPLLDIPCYKPITGEWVAKRNEKKRNRFSFKGRLAAYIKAKAITFYRWKNIRRIDYLRPVIPIEYEMIKQNSRLRAKEFGRRGSTERETGCFGKHVMPSHKVLVGNSATETNNHLDILDELMKKGLTDYEYVFPLNYGDMYYRDMLEGEIKKDLANVQIIHDMMPREDYFQLLAECPSAIFGVMRQQAMGNILWCLSHGIKVFLYKDSVVYKYLKRDGFIVYTIEDMTDKELCTPLTEEEAQINLDRNYEKRIRARHLYDNVIEEIAERINR